MTGGPLHGTLPVAVRLLRGLWGDRRTMALVFVVPAVLIYLFGEVFTRPGRVAPVLLGLFVYLLTYVLTAIGFLRERQHGTLERVLVSPVSRAGLVVGYVIGFGVLAALQAAVLLVAGVVFLDVSFAHGIGLFFAVELLGALSALGLGILLSLFAQNEFQVLQFMPAVIAPQVILGGTFVPVESLPAYLEVPARAMPVTYLLEGLAYVVRDTGTAGDLWIASAALAAFTLLTVGAGSTVVRRAG